MPSADPAPRPRRRHRRRGAAPVVIAGLLAATLLTTAAPSSAQTDTPLPVPPPVTDHTPPTVTIQLLTRLRASVVKKGIDALVTLDEPGSIALVVRDAQHHQVSKNGSGLASLPNGGTVQVRATITPATRAKVRRGGKIRWTIQAIATDGTGNMRVVSVPFRLG